MDNDEDRKFWTFVEETSKSVAEDFPAWKRGDSAIALDRERPRDSNSQSQKDSQVHTGPKVRCE